MCFPFLFLMFLEPSLAENSNSFLQMCFLFFIRVQEKPTKQHNWSLCSLLREGETWFLELPRLSHSQWMKSFTERQRKAQCSIPVSGNNMKTLHHKSQRCPLRKLLLDLRFVSERLSGAQWQMIYLFNMKLRFMYHFEFNLACNNTNRRFTCITQIIYF